MTQLTLGANAPLAETHARAVRFERDAMPLLDELYAAAMRFTRDRARAGELLVETYVRAYASFGSFEPGGSLRVWLYRNLIANYVDDCRREHRRPGWHRSEVITDWQIARIGGYTSTGLQSVELEALNGLPDDVVTAALDELPDELRMAVYLADVEGFAHREIAEILGTPIGTVVSLLHGGRRRLRDLLTEAARGRG